MNGADNTIVFHSGVYCPFCRFTKMAQAIDVGTETDLLYRCYPGGHEFMKRNAKPVASLFDWSLVRARLLPSFEIGHILVGNVYGHPRFRSATFINTSEVLRIDGATAETANTIYRLKEPGWKRPAFG